VRIDHSHAPTCCADGVLPDFRSLAAERCGDYYYQTGDLAFPTRFRPEIRNILAYFNSSDATAAGGLLKYDKRFWLFEDWAELPKQSARHFSICGTAWDSAISRRSFRGRRIPAPTPSGCCARQRRGILLSEKLFDRETRLFYPALEERT
jgi:hypothetical protein